MAIYKINGMTCKLCVSKITEELNKKFQNVKLDLTSGVLNLEGEDSQNMEIVNGYVTRAGSKYSIEGALNPSLFFTFWPLILTTLMIVGGVFLLSVRRGEFMLHESVLDFIGLFFIFFSFFKLLDVTKFAESFSVYDVLARKWYPFGYFYPFIEAILGVMFLLRFEIFYASIVAEIIMISGLAGVVRALFKKQKIQCACLGGFFNLPMTKVTLFEDIVILASLIYVATSI